MVRFCRFWLGSRLVDELEGFRKNKLYVDAGVFRVLSVRQFPFRVLSFGN